MNDINPQNNGDYTPSEPNPYTGNGVPGTSDNVVASSPSTSESNRPDGFSQNPASSSIPPLPNSTSQYQNPQYGTSQYNGSQPTPQYNASPQASQPSSQYNNPQQTQNSLPPQFGANQPADAQGGAPVFPGNMTGQPYGNPNQGPNNFGPVMAVPLNMPYYGCTPIEAVKRFFLKYVKFSGRASRSEYWWSQLFIFLVSIVIFILDQALLGKDTSFIDTIWELAIIIPQISVAVRRLHDSNKSGWWWLLPYGLYIAAVVVLLVSIGVGIGVGAAMNPSVLVSRAFGAGVIGGVIVGLLCVFAGAILQIVLMVLGPNPQGARFDEAPAPGTFASGQYMPPMNQGNTAGNQYSEYTQPMPQQNPFNQPYPPTPSQPASVKNPYTQAGNSQYPPQAASQPKASSQSQNPFRQQGQQGAQAPQTPQPDNGFGAGNNYENNGNDSVQ
ncbi:DUF805 domain-containing protein [Bifidobacterium sp. ESL0732]|uniref:DUF805 domain-containing protein n=1 Tax=Bifidobacterium sp. ESL0732 TaxID=2983222 RepID=UPI0023F9D5AF|nr:DUF805 domain-containing protein [Bifidobacterium sp. ESL0732]WEV63875.1 DUF805 domain-containing protein [Bifidobacterium sp. ESL0732]